MKNLITAILLLCTCAVHADPINSLLKNKNQSFYRFIEGITSGYYTNSTNRERIVAQYSATYPNNSNDSIRYIYIDTNHHGSAYNYMVLGYPAPSYLEDQGIESKYSYRSTPGVWADTMLYYSNTQVLYGPVQRNIIQYNSNGDIVFFSTIMLTGPYIFDLSTAIYDNQNNIVSSLGFSVIGGNADSSTKRFFAYSQGRLVSDSMYDNMTLGTGDSFRVYEKKNYTYDNNGNLLTLSDYVYYTAQVQTPNYRYLNTYTADNRLQTSEYDLYYNSRWNVMETDSFGYSSNVPYPTYWISKDTSGSSPLIINYHTTSAGLVDSIFATQHAGSSSINSKIIFTYDNYNNPVTANMYQGVGTYYSPTPVETVRYYYETYQPSAVSQVAGKNMQVQVYPNPTNNAIHITGLTGGETISIINMSGQLLIRQTANGNTSQTISLDGLVPGTYIVTVTGNNGNRLFGRQVVKQ